jgi:hypothetical protein
MNESDDREFVGRSTTARASERGTAMRTLGNRTGADAPLWPIATPCTRKVAPVVQWSAVRCGGTRHNGDAMRFGLESAQAASASPSEKM